MIDKQSEVLEAATFRRLLEHLSERKDLQNLDLMNLAGFCRNCLSRWYFEEAQKIGAEIQKEEAQELVYGMPYRVWKEKFQTERSQEEVRTAMIKNDSSHSN